MSMDSDMVAWAKELVQPLYDRCPNGADGECWCPVCDAAYFLDNIESLADGGVPCGERRSSRQPHGLS